MSNDRLNNIGIATVAISEALSKSTTGIQLAKVPLIFPTIMHRQTLDYLSRSNVSISGFASLLIEHPEFFTNFWRRYESSLTDSFNAVLLLCEIGAARLEDHSLHHIRNLNQINLMGKRAIKISKAAANVDRILQSSAEELYLNLRVKL